MCSFNVKSGWLFACMHTLMSFEMMMLGKSAATTMMCAYVWLCVCTNVYVQILVGCERFRARWTLVLLRQ